MILIGTKCQLEQTVTEELTAAAVGSGLLNVFGTPYRIGLMENGTWAPLAAKKMQELLAACKQLAIAEPTVRILSALDEGNLGQLDALVATLCE